MTQAKIDTNDLKSRFNNDMADAKSLASEVPMKKIAAVMGNKDRRRDVSWLIFFYGLMLAGAWIIFYRDGSTGNWPVASTNMIELIKIGVMPVITLVMGYYFGKSE